MADVLIEGIRLPDYGVIMVELQAGGNARYVDAYGEFKYGKATTIPAHGRLIDADMMERECCHGCKNEFHKYGNCIDCVLANAPTVIPAEEVS